MQKTCLLAPAVILWKLLESYGHDPEPLFRRQGMTPEMMREPGARASRVMGDNLWLQAARMIDVPLKGFPYRALDGEESILHRYVSNPRGKTR